MFACLDLCVYVQRLVRIRVTPATDDSLRMLYRLEQVGACMHARTLLARAFVGICWCMSACALALVRVSVCSCASV